MVKQLIRFYRNQRGFSLITVIISMMLLAILGGTMLNLLGGDLEMSTRSLDSERAFYLAETGKEWALMQLLSNTSWNTSTDRDCSHTSEWRTFDLTGGQYKVCCRGNKTGEDANVVLEISGYSPSVANYLAMRKTKVLVKLGTMNAVIQAKNLFDWSRTHPGTHIDGDIASGHYEGTDADSIKDEADDLDVPGSGNRTFAVAGTYPQIDMDYFLNKANYVWDLSRASDITRINGNSITVADPIFTAGATWVNEVAVRNLRIGGWDDSAWRQVASRTNTTSVTLGSPALSSWMVGDRIRTCRRYYQSPSWWDSGIKYIQGDALIDVRTNDFSTSNGFYLIAEGDIAIRGAGTVSMTGQSGTTGEPSLATKDGDIISPDVPDGHNDNQRLRNRNFEGIIYSENGDVSFNYLNSNNATLGNNVILDGEVNIQSQGHGRWGGRGWRGWWRRWRRQASSSGGFDLEPVVIQWQEQ
jgi:Tfp pilus assembly protein PilX